MPPECLSILKASGWRWDFSSLEGQFGGEEEEAGEAVEVGEWLSKGPRGGGAWLVPGTVRKQPGGGQPPWR